MLYSYTVGRVYMLWNSVRVSVSLTFAIDAITTTNISYNITKLGYNMPISEDEFDSRQGYDEDQPPTKGLSKAELRKTNKPIMEKKRRARINQCLNELKDLILEAMKKDPARHTKLEKADILEMTVRHLQNIQSKSLSSAAASDPAVLPRFRQGFAECAAEATKFLSKPPALLPPARSRLRQHLAACIAALHHPQSANIPHDLNGNIHVGGVPLIPSRLPTGELALVLPASSQLSQPLSEIINTQKAHASAFQAVRSAHRPPSPSSSVSSCDSLTSERRTPPQITIGEVFPTPPSQSSFTDSSPETQKPTVSSTTISPDNKILEMRVQGQWKGQLTPPSMNSSAEVDMEKSEEMGYSSTPVIAKKRFYPSENSGRLLKISSGDEPPKKIWKIACTQVSSSQSPRRSPDVKRVEETASSSSSTGSNNAKDMWRPW